ncbi:MAG: polysaccharide biosynthesis protein [Oscillospiraceae bacterium]|nr:polysaccharide biosynthesis protein [Oscillospiraceae bacterium]
MGKRNFVRGAVLLSAASLIGKALSAVFKIPLDRYFIGPEGIAIYQNAYNIYNWMLAITATGVPLAVSNLVADSDEDEAAEIRASAMWFVTFMGVIAAAGLFIFARPLAAMIAGGGSGYAAPAIRVMSVGVVFMGVSSAYRGYFQGRGNMLPSALSQIADSLSKACIGLGVCALLLPKGRAIAAAGAMSGVTVGTVIGSVILLVMGRKFIKVYRGPKLSTAKRIVMLAIPVTLGSAGFSCMMMADNFTVQNILVGLGNSIEESAGLFGYLTRAFMIYNLPATLIAAVTVSVAPACAEAAHSGDRGLLREHAVSSLRLLAFVSAPCMMGCLCFPGPILSLLYGTSLHRELLMFTGALMILIPFTQVVSGILQATGCVWKPIIVLGATLAVKVALNFLLLPAMGIAGAPLATVISYAAGCVVLIVLFRGHMGFGFPVGTFVRPFVAAAIGALAALGLFYYTAAPFIVVGCVMALVYIVMALLLKAIDIKALLRK